MYCKKCGTQIIEGNKFCINCGMPVKKDDSNKKENIVYIDEEKIPSIKDNSIVVPLVFGILLASIPTIVCISSFNKETSSKMNKIIYQVDKI